MAYELGHHAISEAPISSTVTEDGAISVDSLQHGHTLDAVTISGAPMLPEGLQHGHTLDETDIKFIPDALQHGHTLGVTQVSLNPGDIQHTHTLDAIEFELSPHDLQHQHLIETLTIGGRLDDDEDLETAVASPATTMVHLLAVDFYDGTTVNTVRLTTAGQDITATIDGEEQTFVGAGGLLGIGTVQETADRAGQGVELKLSGLDDSVLDPFLQQHFRGRTASIWRAFFDEDTGEVSAGPLLMGRFQQLSEYTVEETPPDIGAPGTVTITTRVESPLAALQQTNPVRCNVDSHNRLLKRAGLTPAGGKDTFFQNLPAIIGKRIRWGPGDTPDAATGTSGGDSSGEPDLGEPSLP